MDGCDRWTHIHVLITIHVHVHGCDVVSSIKSAVYSVCVSFHWNQFLSDYQQTRE